MVLACSTRRTPCPCPTGPPPRVRAAPAPMSARTRPVPPDGAASSRRAAVVRDPGRHSAHRRRLSGVRRRRPPRSSRGLGRRAAVAAGRPAPAEPRSRSTAAATAAASGCRSTARAVGPSPARTRPSSGPLLRRPRRSGHGTRSGPSGSSSSSRFKTQRPRAAAAVQVGVDRGRSTGSPGVVPGRRPAPRGHEDDHRRFPGLVVPQAPTGALTPRHIPSRRAASASGPGRRPASPGSKFLEAGRLTPLPRRDPAAFDEVGDRCDQRRHRLDPLPPRGRPGRDAASDSPVEALRARAIAARATPGHRIHARRQGQWDLYDDSRTQVYRGSLGEQKATTAAIAATTGVVVRSGTAIANTLFHSTGGGATEDNENVFTSATGKIVAGPVSIFGAQPAHPTGQRSTTAHRARPGRRPATATPSCRRSSAPTPGRMSAR